MVIKSLRGSRRLHAVVMQGSCVAGLAALVVLGGAFLLRSPAKSQEAQDEPRSGGGDAPHGAMRMEKQEAQLTAWLGHPSAVQRPAWVSPEYWASLVPKDNAGSAAQVALGQKLYFETRLSKDGTVACATCHDVSRGFADRRATSEGIDDQIGRRNAPTTLNALFFTSQFLDGRAAMLEDQAKLPIINPIEMGSHDDKATVAAIAKDATYQKMFRDAYGRDVNFEDIGRALGAFERRLIFLNAPFDRFMSGQVSAISDDAKAGFVLFHGKGRCVSCHQLNSNNPIGTDNRFHNIGVSARHQDFEGLANRALTALEKDASEETIDQLALQTDLSELGRFVVSRDRADIGAFKTSQLRNVGVTAPYMHDGSIATLWDVMDHYNKGGEANAFLDGGIEPLALSEREIEQLVAFMFALTDDRLAEQNAGELTRQRMLAQKQRPLRDQALAERRVLPFEPRAQGQVRAAATTSTPPPRPETPTTPKKPTTSQGSE
jgi:cytochrome c peroxidase